MEGKLHIILYFREECYRGLSCVGWPVKHPYVPVLLGNLGHFGIVPTFHNPVDEPYLLQVLIRRPFLYSTDLDGREEKPKPFSEWSHTAKQYNRKKIKSLRLDLKWP